MSTYGYAKRYMAHGLSVIPIRAKDKRAAKGWGEYQTRPPTEEELETWFANGEANIAIVTGDVSGVVVLDVDGPEGEESLVGRELPRTVTTITGRGRHLWFAHPGGVVGNKTRFLPGLDLKADGGYVLAPPSVHPDGRRYAFVTGLGVGEVELAPLPTWVLEATRKSLRPNGVQAPPAIGPTTRYGAAVLRKEAERVLAAPNGERNDTLNTCALKVGRYVAGGEIDRGDAEQQMSAAGLRVGLEEREVRATVRSGLEAGMREPKSAPKNGNGRTTPMTKVLTPPSGSPGEGPAISATSTSPPLDAAVRLGSLGSEFSPPTLGQYIESDGYLRIGPGKRLWRYVNGVYRPDGDEYIEQRVRDILHTDFRANRLREVKAWCEANTQHKLKVDPEVEPSMEFINVANGLLYWREEPPRLAPHSPDVHSVIQLPVSWDPNAECPRIMEFLSRVLPDDDGASVRLIFEWFGYCLTPSQRMKKALMLVGDGDTGKSTLLALVTALLGRENVSNASLQSISEHRFTAGTLYGKLANICADIDKRELKETGPFKRLVGGIDTTQADVKYGTPFTFISRARLMFSANEAPGTPDQTKGFYNRWLMVPMTRVISPAEMDRNLFDTLTTPEELSGFLRMSLDGLKRFMVRRRFEVPAVVEETLADYRKRTDTIVGFGDEKLIFDPKAREFQKAVYEAYKLWCDDRRNSPLAAGRFNELLPERYPGISHHPYSGYHRWHGLRLRTGDDDSLGEEGIV